MISKCACCGTNSKCLTQGIGVNTMQEVEPSTKLQLVTSDLLFVTPASGGGLQAVLWVNLLKDKIDGVKQ